MAGLEKEISDGIKKIQGKYYQFFEGSLLTEKNPKLEKLTDSVKQQGKVLEGMETLFKNLQKQFENFSNQLASSKDINESSLSSSDDEINGKEEKEEKEATFESCARNNRFH